MPTLANTIAIIWVAFWLYWFLMALRSKRNTSFGAKQFIGARLIFFVIVVLIFRIFSHQDYSFKNHYLATNNEAVLIVGFIMFLAGLALAIWARVYLGRNWGMPMSQKQDPELVTSGPYRYVRHPIYTGILLAALGSALAASIYWLLMIAFAGPYFIYSALVEEKLMMKQFPKVYPAYKAKTKMLIPFIF